MEQQDIDKLIHTIESIGIVDSPDASIPMPMHCQVLSLFHHSLQRIFCNPYSERLYARINVSGFL
jgi:hypothetical protein